MDAITERLDRIAAHPGRATTADVKWLCMIVRGARDDGIIIQRLRQEAEQWAMLADDAHARLAQAERRE